MKWKLTNRFLMTIMTIVFIVIVINTVLLLVILYKEAMQGISDNADVSGEAFTRNFRDYIKLENGLPDITEAGLQTLERRSAWIQLLDENGTVVKSYFAPQEAPTHYRPVDIVQYYKYQEYDMKTTIYISNFEQYSYLIGIQDYSTSRYILTLDNRSIISTISKYLLYIIIADLVIALIAGLLFGSLLTKPLYVMIDSIQQLKNRDYHLLKVKRPGIYKQVFHNLDDVSTSLQQQEEERKKLEQMRNEWISNISHDMKTPLSSIQGYAELLQDEVRDEERAEYARIIERKSIYMRELIDDFNLTMKLRQHTMPLQLTDVRVESMLRELIIDLLNDPQFSKRDVVLESDAPHIILQLDEHLMKRALLNFILNALIHNDEDTSITICLKAIATGAMIEIRDNGRGMSAEDLMNVFERYYRGSHTENIRGTGLGTAIARDIIEAHHGIVTMESHVGKGTIVRVQLS